MWSTFLNNVLKHSVVPFATLIEDRPIVRPMTLSVVGQRLYTHSASDAKKIDQLRRNTRFSFYIDDGAGSVHFVHGRAAFTDDIEEKDGVFKSNELIRTYFSAPDDRNFCVLRLWVETIDAYNEDGVLESWRNPEFPPNG